jgi:mannose-1-phosphate guanylyltransferase/mannose-6-phosphate isomerase
MPTPSAPAAAIRSTGGRREARGRERLAATGGVPLDAGWSDIGSWDALWEASARRARQRAQGDVLLEDAAARWSFSDGRLVAAVGTRDPHDRRHAGAASRSYAQDRAAQVKEVVAKLKARRRTEAEVHRKVYRPWGHFDLLHAGPGFLVKSLVVKPGGALSLQRHRRRAEHWVVVRGTAKVTRGEEQLELRANQSTYIPLGVMHRLENPGPEQLEIVEVQSGDYLGEDDIERFGDRYGRS